MVQTKMGRYWEQKRWFISKVWPFKTKERRETEVSKMRAHSKSETNVGGQRRSAVAVRNGQAANVGPKPTNVKTFAKKKLAMLGLVWLWLDKLKEIIFRMI